YSKALINLIAGCIFDGLTDEETGLLAGVSGKQIGRLRAGNDCQQIRVSVVERMRKYIALIRDGDDRSNRWQRIAWFLERRYPDRWAKPEVLLNVNTASTTNNVLVITAEKASHLKSRSTAVEAELNSLTPKGNQSINASSDASSTSIFEPCIPIIQSNESTIINTPASTPPSPATPTPAHPGSPTTPSLPRKSQLSGDSSNSKLPESPRVAKRVARMSKNAS